MLSKSSKIGDQTPESIYNAKLTLSQFNALNQILNNFSNQNPTQNL